MNFPLLDGLALVGVAVFAVSGVLAAARHGLDWMGALVLAALTAIGGGTLRDLLLDRPVFWLDDTRHLWVILVTTALTIAYTRFFQPPHGLLRSADALGLALFAILGAQVAEELGATPMIIVMMGVITGVAGGALRDTLVGEIPLIFRATEAIYSTACVAGIALYLGVQAAGLAREPAMLTGIGAIAVLRIAAIIKKIRLPAVRERG
ncbi:MAG: trimeric intracellular cation channel family protein [Pseudomonadota bacterium]